MLVLEGYGMTETSTAATLNRPEDFKFGSVGKPFHGVEVKIAEDGEVLLSGPNIFRGYYKNEEATDETIVDGWLHTGDLGSIDEDGFLYITGRKKDIIITAGGKNITPANLENGLKQNQYISQAVVYGDRRPYLTALSRSTRRRSPPTRRSTTCRPTDVTSCASTRGAADRPEGPRPGELEGRARRAGQEVHDPAPRPDARRPASSRPTLKVKRNIVYEKYARRVRRDVSK